MIKILLSYSISTLMYLLYIFLAKRYQITQTERELGPESHKRKNGTITSGGIIFVNVFILLTSLTYGITLQTIYFLLPTILIFLIGLLDDMKVIKLKNNEGLSVRFRLIIEVLIASLALLIYAKINYRTSITIFNKSLNIFILFPMFFIFCLVGAINSFNLTDGLDGLLASTTLVILITLLFMAKQKNEYMVVGILLFLIGSLLSFYFFNYPNALMFMGDAGSLSLGIISFLIAIYLKEEVSYIIISLPIIFETISDIIQVSYYKLSKGKRIFKMAPFHHHLELSGFNETSIKTLFVFTEVLLSLLVLYLGGYIWKS